MKSIVANAMLLLILASCAPSKPGFKRLTFASNPVIAHRGAFKAKDLPENSIASKVIELSPGAQTQYLNGEITPEGLKKDGISGADYHFSVFKKNPEWIGRAQKSNIILNAWTVNEREDMQWLLENKFQFITTNEPELLLSIWKPAASVKK